MFIENAVMPRGKCQSDAVFLTLVHLKNLGLLYIVS